jgi:hypothetical protein
MLKPLALVSKPLIILSVVGVWWLLLTLFVIRSYVQRVRDARALTLQQLKDIEQECRRFEESMPEKRWRRRDYFFAGPFVVAFILFLLPCYLYAWFLEHRDPYDRHKAYRK